MNTLNRAGQRKRDLKNLLKRGGVWYFKQMLNGKVESVSLNTGGLELAKARRNKLREQLVKEKWEVIDQVRSKRNLAGIGEVIARYKDAKDLQLAARTYDDNAWALRKILRRVKGVDAVDGLAVSVLDGNLVREWQQLCLAEAGTDKLKLDSAAVSANSMLGQARSLFGKGPIDRKIYEGLVLSDLKAFMTAPRLEELKRDDYHKPEEGLLRKVWAEALKLKEGTSEWQDGGGEDEEWQRKQQLLWVLFFVAAETGFRKGEVCALRYRWFVAGGVRTLFEADFVPKGKRERTVPVLVDVEFECRRMAFLNQWPMEAEDYVLPGSPWQKEKLFKAFGRWLKWAGWTRRQKAHEWRKIFASNFLENSTPYEAQLVLGHRDLKTTSRYAARGTVQAISQAARYGAPVVLPDPPKEEKAA